MANFCKNCGKPLAKGEICNCNSQNNINGTIPNQNPQQHQNNQQSYANQQQSINQQPNYYTPPVPAKKIKLIPIGQIVGGGLLALEWFLTMDWAWGEISLIAGAAFLWTGILSLLNKQ